MPDGNYVWDASAISRAASIYNETFDDKTRGAIEKALKSDDPVSATESALQSFPDSSRFFRLLESDERITLIEKLAAQLSGSEIPDVRKRVLAVLVDLSANFEITP